MNFYFDKLFLGICVIGCAVMFALPCCAADGKRTYEADVRPILKANCFQCHGESGHKEGKLDLRLRRFIVSGGESGPAIVPGKPAESRLLKRVRTGEMPPDENKRLSAKDVATIEQWIAAGAPTARDEPESIADGPVFTEEERNWWAFRPVKRPTIPSVADAAAIQTPIDAFLLASLEQEAARVPGNSGAYRFAPLASPETLLRRASFDLLGLPPTPQQSRIYEADRLPGAWERLIDRLLASPHYGERWGRHWLDVAGYADSEGHTDEDRVRQHVFRFRDYVIRSFNADTPFDQFIVEQLAGDELLPRSEYSSLSPLAIEKLTATGFLRMAPDGTASGGIDQNLARNQVIADTLQIVGTSLLGLTINCAQCHDHRYDPIPQVDYYKLRAIFAPALDWKNWKPPPSRQISLYSDTDHKTRSRIEAEAKKVDAERQKHVEYYIARTLEQELLLVADRIRDQLRIGYRTKPDQRTSEQKALLNDYPSIEKISAGALYLYERRRDARIRDIEAKRAEKQKQFIATAAARELKAAVATTPEKRTTRHRALLKSYPNVVVTAKSLAKLDPEAAVELDVYTQAVAEIRKSRIKKHLQEFTDKTTEIRATIPKENFIRALTETPGKLPATFVFHRGDHDQPKRKVQPASLSVLGEDAGIPNNDAEVPTSGRRLRFARHLTSGRHPLVARVIVNRIWMHHFGRGLVNSPGDFGVLGERPTHPKLLDWLAAEFVDAGWSVKHMHRLIMSSTAYQQSSARNRQLVEADPENRLYGRMSIRRLESEALRDAILAVSGKLNDGLFGEPVPVMEDEVGQIVIGQENLDGERKPTKKIPLLGEEFRRSVYVQVRRSRPLAVLETFDSPAMTPNCDRRASSNVALQSLMLMNSDFAITYAQSFAQRLMAEAGDDPRDQIKRGWTLAFGISPSENDLDAATRFVELQRQTLSEAAPDTKSNESYQQALASFCQALLGSNRFVYVE